MFIGREFWDLQTQRRKPMNNFLGILAASMPLAPIDELSDEASPGQKQPCGPSKDPAKKKPAAKKKTQKAQSGLVKKKPAAASPAGDGTEEADSKLPKSYKCFYKRDGTWGIKLGKAQLFSVPPSAPETVLDSST